MRRVARALALLWLVPALTAFDGAQARAALDRAFQNLYGPDVLAGVELRIRRAEGGEEQVEFAFGRKRKGDETRTLLFGTDTGRDAPRALLFQSRGEGDRMFVSSGKNGNVEPLPVVGVQLFGSDFSFEDLRAHEADEFRIEVLGQDRVGTERARVLRLRPLGGPYVMLLAWLSEERPVLLRIDYFDTSGLWKRYRVDPQALSDELGWWVPLRDEMRDLRSGSSTLRVIRNLVVDAEVPDELFSVSHLARGRLPRF
jgi:hypothetical protein